MEIIKKINTIALIITLVLYLTIFLGLIAQFVLGLIQVIIGIYITVKCFRYSIYAKKHLSLYWSFVFLEFALMFLFINYCKTSNDFYQILIFAIFPMSIAFYFTFILNKIIRNYENA